MFSLESKNTLVNVYRSQHSQKQLTVGLVREKEREEQIVAADFYFGVVCGDRKRQVRLLFIKC